MDAGMEDIRNAMETFTSYSLQSIYQPPRSTSHSWIERRIGPIMSTDLLEGPNRLFMDSTKTNRVVVILFIGGKYLHLAFCLEEDAEIPGERPKRPIPAFLKCLVKLYLLVTIAGAAKRWGQAQSPMQIQTQALARIRTRIHIQTALRPPVFTLIRSERGPKLKLRPLWRKIPGYQMRSICWSGRRRCRTGLLLWLN
jgi:hypothetical protein